MLNEEKLVMKYCNSVGYTEDETQLFLEGGNRSRFVKGLLEAAALYLIEVEVVNAKNCASRYKVGDKFILDIAGNFISKYCPERMCIYLISQLGIPVALINERLSEGLDPNDFTFMKQVKCLDAGVECEGYGEVMLRVKVVDRRSIG